MLITSKLTGCKTHSCIAPARRVVRVAPEAVAISFAPTMAVTMRFAPPVAAAIRVAGHALFVLAVSNFDPLLKDHRGNTDHQLGWGDTRKTVTALRVLQEVTVVEVLTHGLMENGLWDEHLRNCAFKQIQLGWRLPKILDGAMLFLEILKDQNLSLKRLCLFYNLFFKFVNFNIISVTNYFYF